MRSTWALSFNVVQTFAPCAMMACGPRPGAGMGISCLTIGGASSPLPGSTRISLLSNWKVHQICPGYSFDATRPCRPPIMDPSGKAATASGFPVAGSTRTFNNVLLSICEMTSRFCPPTRASSWVMLAAGRGYSETDFGVHVHVWVWEFIDAISIRECSERSTGPRAARAGRNGRAYPARDTRLGRDVALKILPETFASHPDRPSP